MTVWTLDKFIIIKSNPTLFTKLVFTIHFLCHLTISRITHSGTKIGYTTTIIATEGIEPISKSFKDSDANHYTISPKNKAETRLYCRNLSFPYPQRPVDDLRPIRELWQSRLETYPLPSVVVPMTALF